MSTDKSYVAKAFEQFNEWRFRRISPFIRNTPSLELGDEPFTLLSMVHHRDVDTYLIAVKSFCRFLAPRRIAVVTDPSITDDDKQAIAAHIRGVAFMPAEDLRDALLPQGGCWERLTAISDLVADNYVVQLDADTIALADMPEVRECIRSRRSFVLATEDGQEIASCKASADWAKVRLADGEHVQVLAESHLDTLSDSGALRYVRGCAGFCGFAPGSFSRDAIRRFSAHMAAALRDKWSAWGTEEFTLNFMVANSPSGMVLPHPKYCHPGRERPGTVFLHFIGYVRFATGRYSQAARRICEEFDEASLIKFCQT